jgi:hypothetical protein
VAAGTNPIWVLSWRDQGHGTDSGKDITWKRSPNLLNMGSTIPMYMRSQRALPNRTMKIDLPAFLKEMAGFLYYGL